MNKSRCIIFGQASRVRYSNWTSSGVAICDDAKAKLRQLYRLVHPDLFLHSDEERARTNEKSFKLLQDYISNASQSASHRSSAPYHASYNFEFYVAGRGDGSQDSKISLNLPSPSSASPMATRRNLNKLFRAVGIDGISCVDVCRDSQSDMPHSLQAFIPLVHEQYLVDLTDTNTPQMTLRTMLAALNYSRRLRVVFSKDTDPAAQSTLGKVQLLQNFMEVVEHECPAEINGLTIGFGNAFSQHVNEGAIWLDVRASPESWAKFIDNVDLNQMHDGLEAKAALRQLAVQAADALGVASVHAADSSYSVQLSDAYESFLLSVLRSTPANTSKSKYEGVVLSVVSDDGELHPDKHVEHGVLYVAATAPLAAVLSTLRTYGPRAEEHVRRRRHEFQHTKALVTQVERTLRLRLLSKDPALEDFRYKTACQKLLASANELLPILEGLKLRVGEQNAYVTGRGIIDIAWDFRV